MTLSPSQWHLLAIAVVLLARSRWRLTHIPLHKLIDDLSRPWPAVGKPETVTRELAWAIATAAAFVPWRSDCLVKAIAASLWARRLGIPCEFHLGVQIDSARALDAHAWTISGSQILSGEIADLANYREFAFDNVLNGKLHFPH